MIVISSTSLNFLQKAVFSGIFLALNHQNHQNHHQVGLFFRCFFLQVRQMIDDITDRPIWVDLKGKAPGPGQLASKYRVMWDFIMDGICIYTIFIGFSKLWSLCFSSISHIHIYLYWYYIYIYLHVGMQLYNMLIQGPYMIPPHFQSEDSVPETVHHVVLYIDPCPFFCGRGKKAVKS